MNVTAETVLIKAQTPTGAARAFATLMQMPLPSELNVSDPKMYQMQQSNFTDYPNYGWRQYSMDACAHYMTMKDIKRIIDATSM